MLLFRMLLRTFLFGLHFLLVRSFDDLVLIKVNYDLGGLWINIPRVLLIALADLFKPHDLCLLGVLLMMPLLGVVLLGGPLRGRFLLFLLLLFLVRLLRVVVRVRLLVSHWGQLLLLFRVFFRVIGVLVVGVSLLMCVHIDVPLICLIFLLVLAKTAKSLAATALGGRFLA